MRRFKAMLHEDRGDSVVGSAIAIALWAAGFGLLAMMVPTSLEMTRTSINHGMAANAADAAIKNARVISWHELGTAGAPGVDLLPTGYTPVTAGALAPVESFEMRGVPITVRTSVGKQGAGAYGTKMISVEVTWDNYPSGVKHTIAQSALLSPPAGAVAPATIPNIGG